MNIYIQKEDFDISSLIQELKKNLTQLEQLHLLLV